MNEDEKVVKKEAKIDREHDEKLTVEKVDKVLKKKSPIRMSFLQYMKANRPEVSIYTRAYFQSGYRGTILANEEWKKELKGKF